MSRPTPFPSRADFLNYPSRRLWHGMLAAFFRRYLGARVLNAAVLERTPGPLIIVANHTSHIDGPLLWTCFPPARVSSVFTLAAKDYFFNNPLEVFFSRSMMNSVPFDRTQAFRQSLRMTRELLKNPRNSVILFPEGGRSSDGSLKPFKAGVGALAAGLDVRLIPAHIRGAYEAWPKGQSRPSPGKISVIFGEPLAFPEATDDKAGWTLIGKAMHGAVEKLAAQA